jgi:DNA-binding NarL/FixJ family response regulator
MLECSTRVIGLLASQLEQAHLKTQELGDGLELTSPSGFVDWHNFPDLCQRAAEVVGGPERLADLCASTFTAALPEGAHLMKLAGEPVAGLELVNAFADASFFTHLRYAAKRTGARTFRVSARFQEEPEGMRFFAAALSGNLRAATSFAGLPHASVRTSFRARACDFELTLPSVNLDEADSLERRTRRAFLGNCRRQLARGRETLLQAQRSASLVAISTTYASLSAIAAQAMAGEQRQLMPNAAVRAIAEALRCRRVAITRLSCGTGQRQTLAELGEPALRVVSVEVETSGSVLLIQASIARGSPEEAALRRLGPWLALVFDAGHAPGLSRAPDWQEARLAELAARWRLTPRQCQVAFLMAQGDSNKSIGAKLGCTEGTVELHARAITLKAALPSRAALAAYFFAGG